MRYMPFSDMRRICSIYLVVSPVTKTGDFGALPPPDEVECQVGQDWSKESVTARGWKTDFVSHFQSSDLRDRSSGPIGRMSWQNTWP